MANKLLEKLKKQLLDEGMDCTIFEESDEIPAPKLVVYLGVDNKKREKILEVTAEEQILPANFKDFQHMQVQSSFYRLQIQSFFPIQYKPKSAANVASCINLINGLLELPGLISDEVNNKICYRCVQLVSHDLDLALFIGIVGMHRMVQDIFIELLEKIGSGEMTYFEFIDEIAKYSTLQTKKVHA